MHLRRLTRPLIFSFLSCCFLIAAALAMSACRSRPPRGPVGADVGPQRIEIPELRATAEFFEQRIEASVRFGRAEMPRRPRVEDETGGPPSGGPKGGGPRGGFGAGPGGGFSGGGPSDGDPRGGGMRRPGGGGPAGGGRGPTVQLELALVNRGSETVEVEVLEFNSLLGNFVVAPAKVALTPGQKMVFEPMRSNLGIPEGELPITVKLRSGGKTEQQKLLLK